MASSDVPSTSTSTQTKKAGVIVPSNRKPCKIPDLLAKLKAAVEGKSKSKHDDDETQNRLAIRCAKFIINLPDTQWSHSIGTVLTGLCSIRHGPSRFLSCFVEKVKLSKIGAEKFANSIKNWARSKLVFSNANEVDKVCNTELKLIDDLCRFRAVDLKFYREMINPALQDSNELHSLVFIFRVMTSVDFIMDLKGVALSERDASFWKDCAQKLQTDIDQGQGITPRSRKRAQKMQAFLSKVEEKGGWNRPGKRVFRQPTIFESFAASKRKREVEIRTIVLDSDSDSGTEDTFIPEDEESNENTTASNGSLGSVQRESKEPPPKIARELSASNR